jgi:3-keto-disaccharide hydrolase
MKRFGCFILVMFLSVICTVVDSSATMSLTWFDLFNGKSLDGWKASENPGSFIVRDGMLVCQGPRAHLFYNGDLENAEFQSFELVAEVMATPGANSGIYFHTQYQEEGWPTKGYEVQINNTHRGDGEYRELKKTGSLYSVRNLYKSIVKDNEWFTLRIKVIGKTIEISVNDIMVVNYTEPEKPSRSKVKTDRRLTSGTFAIQCHDPDSKVYFKSIKVAPIPINSISKNYNPIDDRYKQIQQLHEGNFPVVDFHVHLKGGLTIEQAISRSLKNGINYGIAPNCGVGFPITDDAGIDQFIESMKGKPVFVGMQAEGREWVNMFSKEAIAKFDYVFSDSLTFTDDQGRRTRLWMKDEVWITDKQAFMDMYVKSIQSVISNEPIDIFVNPTFLPECIAEEYDELWTEERMMKMINAAVKHNVAIEINARYRIPSAKFIKLAKKAGCKFAMGTNNMTPDLGRLEYSLDMVKECGLTWTDMFLPKSAGWIEK